MSNESDRFTFRAGEDLAAAIRQEAATRDVGASEVIRERLAKSFRDKRLADMRSPGNPAFVEQSADSDT
jgi:hypothetical protein